MAYKDKIVNNYKLKRLAHWLLFPRNDFRPRWWVRKLWNPLKRRRGKNSVIRSRVRLDNLPFNKFHLGEKSLIEDYTVINNQIGDVIIGKNTLIGLSNVIIGPVHIGDNVMLAQNVAISGLNHNYVNVNLSIRDQDVYSGLIIIEDDVWVGVNAVIVPSVRIGKHAIVAAGAVVTRSVPPYSLVAGNPAKVLKQYNFKTKHWEKVHLSKQLNPK